MFTVLKHIMQKSMLELENIHQFIKERKAILWISIISVLGVYGYKLIHYTVGIDTEMAIADYEASLNWILGGGRFSGVILRKLIMPNGFNYFLAMVIAILMLIVANVIFAFVLHNWGMENTSVLILFLVLFLTFPTFAEIFYFSGACYSIALGICLSIISVHFISKWVYLKKPLKYMLIGSGLGLFTVGLYQAFLFLIIAEMVAIFILRIENNKKIESIFCLMKYAWKLLCVIFLITICYLLISRICVLYFYKQEMLYAGYTNAQNYISGQIIWSNNTIGQGISNVVNYIYYSLEWDNIFGSVWILALFLINLIAAILKALWKKQLKYIYIACLFLVLFVTPYLGVIMKGNAISAREQIILPFILAFMGGYTLNYCIEKKLLKRFFLIGMSYLAWSEILITVGLFQTDVIRYQKDYTLAEQIIHSVEKEYDSYRDKAIVFVGGKASDLPSNCLLGEVIGGSFFNWDRYTEWGVNYRVFYFLKSIGVEYCMPETDDILLGKVLAEEMDAWPVQNSIKMQDQIIVVKLSN